MGDTSSTDVTVRTERQDDDAAIDVVVASAFGQRDEADLVRALRSSTAWLPQLSLVAELDHRVVGHAAFTRAHVDGVPVLALAPVSVIPDAQHRGIGTALVEDGISRARADGESLIVVLGDPAYYGRFGFTAAAAMGVSGPFGPIVEFQCLPLADAFPTGTMRYPAAFRVDDPA